MERQTRRTEEEKERKSRSRHTVGSKSMGLHWSNNIFSKITKKERKKRGDRGVPNHFAAGE
jgi:hypothetical protein